ncbi:MAG: cation-transporting P-type ATPase [Desulfurivibrio sp.]|nr:cation-transporting P-type ATPase [Desulfurivibrio sp.]
MAVKQETDSDSTPDTPTWFAREAEEAVKHFQADPEQGLSATEGRQRLARYGANVLTPPRKQGPFKRFLLQFHNVLIYVLLVAAVVTTLLGHWLDAGVIFGVVMINALIGFIQEGKAERALEAIRDMLSQHAVVLRDGKRQVIAAEELVPGDIVFLQSGDKVPADLRLLKSKELRVDEASLTGESMAVEKHPEPVAANTSIGDRFPMSYSGTLVTSGQGSGVVVATGDHTELGRINKMLSEVSKLTTRLLVKMAEFGRKLTVAIFIMAAGTFAFGYLLRDYDAIAMFLAVVSLAVAAIPEGLPAIITITLALGVQAMAGRNAIIRRLPAVETLGSVTVICSDKTGTLTKNEMTVQEVVTTEQEFTVSGIGYAPRGGFSRNGEDGQNPDINPVDYPLLEEICRAGLLCNEAELVPDPAGGEQWQANGAPTEAALLTMAYKAGLERESLQASHPRRDLIPFASEHKFMATLHHDHQGNSVIYLKGAPEMLLQRCSGQWRDGAVEKLDREFWEKTMEKIAARGQRLLALAKKPAASGQQELTFDDVQDGVILLGLVGIIDPPRDEAIVAVQDCRNAGIRVKMITGDHASTARAIAARMQIGEGENSALTGREIEGLSDDSLRRQVKEVDVFARVSPEHKLRLVRLLQEGGEVVAMTGDGVNDAPALKKADVGVAMGVKGTEVAKEASEMVLTDDNFASIAHAVREGRTVYNNIRKSIAFILPTNGGEAGVIIAAILFSRMLPITPVQILWVNMITAVTLALALAFEPSEADVMRKPPRPPNAAILDGFLLWRVVLVALIMVAGVFGFFVWKREMGAEIAIAQTTAVNTMVLFEIFYLLNTRSLHRQISSIGQLLENRYILLAIAAVVVFQLIFTYAPFMHHLFGTAPVAAGDWPLMIIVAASVFVIVEFEKWLLRHHRPGHTTS